MRNDIVGLARQADLDTMETTMEHFLPVEGAEPSYQRELIEVEETMGHRFPSDPEYGTRYWEVGVSGAARLESSGALLANTICLPVSTQPDAGGAPTAYEHVFDPAADDANVPEPFSWLIHRADPSPAITDLFYGVKGNELTLSVEPNANLAFEASLIAKELDDSQPAPTPVRDTSARMPFHKLSAFIAIDGGAEVEVPVASFSLSLGNALETDDAVLGSRSLFSLDEGNMSAEVSFSVRQALSEHYRRAMLEDPEAVAIRLAGVGANLGGAVTELFQIEVPRCHYLDAPAPVDASTRLRTIDVTARCAYDESAGFVKVTLVNEHASY